MSTTTRYGRTPRSSAPAFILTPAYGRDYTSGKAAQADWEANKDFLIANADSRWVGKPINREQAPDAVIIIRYKKLTRQVRITPNP